MKLRSVFTSLAVCWLAFGAASVLAQIGGKPDSSGTSAVNPMKVALLHWYLANTTTNVTVGSQPYGICFDGANIWTANYGGGSVPKMRGAPGAGGGAVPGPPRAARA